MINEGYLLNFSYVFIPFALAQGESFDTFHATLAKSTRWERVAGDTLRYLHRYVSDRLLLAKKEGANFYHYRLLGNPSDAVGGFLHDHVCRTAPKKFRGKSGVTFDFTIADVQLFSFNTSIGMMAFGLKFRENDPFIIAAAQYYLRKLSAECFYVTVGEETHAQNFIDLSKQLLGDACETCAPDFFFYAAPKNERANFFTYIDVPEQGDHQKELFYLKWCYHDGFAYEDDLCEGDSLIYAADAYKVWGLSPSAAVCLVTRREENRAFIENVFQKNVLRQYLLTYVLLLHQKYMMYLFLTKLSVGIDDDLARLEQYQHRLYEFETSYMFSKVSEVPQYQRFYDKVQNVFALKEMFEDVREPLSRLVEIRRQSAEEHQRKYDDRINAALMTLSLLTVVSAITDATAVTENLGWMLPPLLSRIIQTASLSLVGILSIWMLIRLFFLKNKR